ncbi:TIGR04255 family protein [Agrobacterium vitis]|uniref:TIGR04255 family protein n=2 Tax=Agrobacterium vitis TaxID=373 RepID=A0AAE4WDN5_AGRVI|nr:TIGR04255 family protein [Allorhizobium sp. Av2]MUZ58484.1 TIGR04255 family protein [Agrobacterium vitis]MVA65822.1 TIGR04255 family protein [Agrobacterium vitis]MVA88156.1 TIGR04255 family protein [Agrobacterium vitis]
MWLLNFISNPDPSASSRVPCMCLVLCIVQVSTKGRTTMAKANNAPVKYVIGVVRFPAVADLDKFAGAIQTALGDEYPFGKPQMVTEVGVMIDDGGVKVQQTDTPVWQFLNKTRDCGIIVNRGLVGVHTTAYVDHQHFITEMMKVIETVRKIEGGPVRYVEALAMRYVDVIEPLEGGDLLDYIDAGVLPSRIDVDGLDVNEGMHVLIMKSAMGNVRLQVLRNPNTVLPSDLHSPLLIENGWSLERPTGEFVTIDTDHAAFYAPPREFAKVDFEGDMLSLRKPISDIFTKIATPYAMEVWGLK